MNLDRQRKTTVKLEHNVKTLQYGFCNPESCKFSITNDV